MLKNEGFSLIELIVVMFILSILAFFTLPLFRAPGNIQDEYRQKSISLARFLDGLRQKAVREHSDYALHLDIVSGKAWAERLEKAANDETDNDKSKINDSASQKISLSGLPISGVEIAGTDFNALEDITIHFSHSGITDMALIRMEEDDEIVTIKLHPFIGAVEIIHGGYSFNDCP